MIPRTIGSPNKGYYCPGSIRPREARCTVCQCQLDMDDKGQLCPDCLSMVMERNPIYAEGYKALLEKRQKEMDQLIMTVMSWSSIEDLDKIMEPVIQQGHIGLQLSTYSDEDKCFELVEHVKSIANHKYELEVSMGGVALVGANDIFRRLFSKPDEDAFLVSGQTKVLSLQEVQVEKYKETVDRLEKQVEQLLIDNAEYKKMVDELYYAPEAPEVKRAGERYLQGQRLRQDLAQPSNEDN